MTQFFFEVSCPISVLTFFALLFSLISRFQLARCRVCSLLFMNLKNKNCVEGKRQREIRTASKMLIVIGAFIVCHLPHAITRMLDVLRRHSLDDVSINVTVATKWLSFAKSALDPFIYFVLQRRFRKTLAKSFLPHFLSTN